MTPSFWRQDQKRPDEAERVLDVSRGGMANTVRLEEAGRRPGGRAGRRWMDGCGERGSLASW